MKSKSITVFGRVQNVGFRYYTLQAANKYGISGFVKNQADGRVYIEAEAEEVLLNEFIDWCKKGPGHAHVTDVRIEEMPIMGHSGFKIKS
ncbi:MAG: acylphosphatase [Bacteroidales bacterium]|nr:acylphosphatase [Bacteroidales bacterium]MCF8456575.1 acylphosphatase [Bacteroidales bacterium]